MKMDADLQGPIEMELQALRTALADCRAQLAEAIERNAADHARDQRYAAIIEASHDAIWTWNLDGTITSWNKEAERLFGYAEREIVGKSLLQLVPADRLDGAREAIARLRAGGWFRQYETIRLRKDGSPLNVELTVSPIRNPADEIVGAATVCRDITQRKQSDEMLARRMEEVSTLYAFTDRLYRAEKSADVFEAALDAIKRAMGCSRASILLCDDDGVMRFVAWRGLSDAYRTALEGHSPWKAGEREAQPIVVEDIARSDEPEQIKTAVAREGIRALAFIPLTARGGVIGKFMAYYEEPRTFSDHEVSIALTLARQLGISLERIRMREARELVEAGLRESEERFRLMSEAAPVMIWMSEANGACLHLNRMLREFWGIAEDDLATFNWLDTMHPDDAAEIVGQMTDALANRRSVTIKGRYRRVDGRYRVLQTDARPRFSSTGEFLGMIGVNVDTTEREEADAALRDSEENFRLAVEAAPSGMIMTDAGGHIVMINAHAERLLGYRRDELVGQRIERLVPKRFRAQHPALRSAYIDEAKARPMGAGRDLFALHKDGSEIPVEIGLSPLLTSKGMMALAAVVDISSRKEAESHRELLIAELNHRVKNTLAVIQGIANQTFKGERASPEAKEAFEGRIIALACAHDLLTRSNWENAALAELAADTLQAHGPYQQRISLSGPEVLLSPRYALALGLALHELFTNAVKYGALSNDSGRVELVWSCTPPPDRMLRLVWRETGGPEVVPPTRRGFGSLLLERMLAQDLHGTVATEFDPQGLRCSISTSLSTHAKTGRFRVK